MSIILVFLVLIAVLVVTDRFTDGFTYGKPPDCDLDCKNCDTMNCEQEYVEEWKRNDIHYR